MVGIASIIQGVVGPVAGIFQANIERKSAAEAGNAKLAVAKEAGDTEITLKDKEWEAIAAKAAQGSWKDEYVTIIITSPLVLIIIGAIIQAAFGYSGVLDGVSLALDRLAILKVDMGALMYIVVLAAIGFKGLNSWRR